MEKTLINKYPATRWNDATPLGNGVLGASVYGCVYDERILINHESLFNWCEDKEIPDISSSLAEVRKLMDEGKYKEAESYYTKMLEKEKYCPSSGKYYPALDLHLLFENNDAFKNYSRKLDMENGVCTVEYTDGENLCEREVFASQTDKAIIVKISSKEPISLRLALEKHDLVDLPDSGGSSEQKTTPLENGIYAEFATQGGLNYAALLKILKTDGTVSEGKSKKRKIDMTSLS